MRISKVVVLLLAVSLAPVHAKSMNGKQYSSERELVPRLFRVNNKTTKPMIALSLSISGSATWDENILGRRVVPSDTSFIISIDPRSPCAYDFKAHFEQGESMIDRRIDTCEQHELNYGDYI